MDISQFLHSKFLLLLYHHHHHHHHRRRHHHHHHQQQQQQMAIYANAKGTTMFSSLYPRITPKSFFYLKNRI
jgi:hypothetical protein